MSHPGISTINYLTGLEGLYSRLNLQMVVKYDNWDEEKGMMLFWISAIQKVVWETPPTSGISITWKLKTAAPWAPPHPTEAEFTWEQELQKIHMPSALQSWSGVT